MLVIVLLISLVITYTIVNLTAIFRRNQKAFRFYQEKCPNLPTAPGPGMFTGHLLSIIMNDYGWKTIDELHNKLGPSFGMFHVNKPWVATKDIDLIKLIEVDEARKHTNRAFLGGPLEHFNNSLFQIFDEDWRRTRQVVAPTLTNLVVKGKDVSSDVEFVVDKLSSSLKRKLNKSKEAGGDSFELHIRDTCERFALAVIFLVTYQQNDMIDFDAEQDKWTQLFAQGARDGANPLTLASMMFPFLRKAITVIARFSPFGRWEANIVGYIQDAVNKKTMQLERGDESKTNSANEKIAQPKRTLLDTLIEAYTAKKIKYEHFMGSLLLLVLAGAVTTADTISCLIWQLAWNPDIQERLRESIAEEGIGSEYLSWCINETIRWHPAVPMGTGRILGEDVEVNGQYLPRGTFVMPSTYSIHHDAKIWPEPDKFDPDRWRNQANFHPAAFVGFGLGPRNCLGRFLAVHEMKLVLKMILSQYKIEPCAKTPKEWRFRVPAMLYTLMDEPLMIRLRPLSTN